MLVGAGEMHGAGITGDRVAERVHNAKGERHGCAAPTLGRQAGEQECRGSRWIHGDRCRPGHGRIDRVGGRDLLGSGRLER